MAPLAIYSRNLADFWPAPVLDAAGATPDFPDLAVLRASFDKSLDRKRPAPPARAPRVVECLMKKISVSLTLEELQALVTLADNQLFRVKYIDPKMPGYIVQPKELEVASSAVQILGDALKAAKDIKPRTVSAANR